MYKLLNIPSGNRQARAIFSLLCLLLLSSTAFATDWYVSAAGDDQKNTGRSPESPYRTIQKATDAAQAGDVVNVMAGTYREQVDVKSGVTFRPNGGDVVTLDGTEVLTGWTLEAGSTYRASMDWNADTLYRYGDNQLFEDKTMIELLRWPKQTSPDIIMPTNGKADNVVKSNSNPTYIELTDSKFDQGDGRWNGAKIWINLSRAGHDGQGWTGTVVSAVGNTIIVDFRSESRIRIGGEPWGLGRDTEYFLFDPTPEGVAIAGGVDNMLAPGEWWKNEITQTVYVKTRDKNAPNATVSNVIEAKKRQFGFWSSNETKSNYTIEGFRFFACSVTTVPNAQAFNVNDYLKKFRKFAEGVSNVTLDGLDFTYPSHQTDMTGNWQSQHSGWTGVVLNGTNSVIKNCKIRYTATSAISLHGENLKVLNNEIESTNYFCTNPGTINCGHWVRDAEIAYNKLWNMSTSGIYLTGSANSNPRTPERMRVHHNRIWDFMRRNDDSGAIESGFLDAQWARIDHNVIFNTLTDASQGDQKAGIYFDYGQRFALPRNYNGRWTVDHNVIYNIVNPILLNEINNVNIFNNVLLTNEFKGPKQATIQGHTSESDDEGSTFGKGLRIINNIMSQPPNRDANDPFSEFRLAEVHNNIMNASIGSQVLESLFVDPSNPDMTARNYALKEGSPAIDKGVSVGKYDDGIIEEPDLGAYERGADGKGEDATPPSQPAVPSVGNTQEDSFTLSWPATADVGGGVAYYELSTVRGSAQLSTRYTEVPTINVRALARSTEYTFNLVAVDGMGLRSDPATFTFRSADRLPDITIPRTATAPSLDGIREAGAYNGDVLAIAKLGQDSKNADIPYPANAADQSGDWTATWDEKNLYIHVNVVDDIRRVDSKDWYNDDNVEIFLNGNGERPGSFAKTDYQFYITPGGTLAEAKHSSSGLPAGAEAVAPDAPGSSTNYTAEFKIPFSALGITTSAELRFIGIEVNVGDDDGATRTRPDGSEGPLVRKMVWRKEAYRSTSTFGLAQLTPQLFDRTDPIGSGVVVSAGEDDVYVARNAFDNNPSTKWLHKSNTSYIEFKFSADGSTKYAITRYTLTSASDMEERDPKDWKLYGTNVANPSSLSDFVEVDRQTGVVFADRGEKRGYNVNPSTAYSTYRLVITATNGAPWTQLAEMKLFAPDATYPLVVNSTSTTLVIGAAPQQLSASQAVTWSSSDEKVVKVSSRGVVTGLVAGTATITATSSLDKSKTATLAITVVSPSLDRTNPVGSGVIVAQGSDDGAVARNAFDNLQNTKWFHKSSTSWIQFGFSTDGAAKYAVNKYTLQSANDVEERDPKDWTLYGTNVANPEFPQDFVAVDSQSGVTFEKRLQKLEFTTSNPTEYSTYRLVITANHGAPAVQLAEMELFAPASVIAKPLLIVTPAKATIVVGEERELTTLVTPLEFSPDVIWSSSNTDVATVDATGFVTGVNIGTATITATLVDDNTLTGSAAIRVVERFASLADRTNPVGSGVVVAKGVDDNLVARNAFDNQSDTKWLHKDDKSWIQFGFSADGSTKYAVAKYTLTSADDVPDRDPKDWTLYGSNATNPEFPKDFVAVDRQSGVTFEKRGEKQEFIISPLPAEYSTYRLDITANRSAGTANPINVIQLAEVELFAPNPACGNCRTSAEAEESLTLRVHPNPASSEVTLDLSGFARESAVQVKMSDMTGKLFVSQQVQLPEGDKKVTLGVSHLPQGLFFVTVQGSKKTKTAKLVITK